MSSAERDSEGPVSNFRRFLGGPPSLLKVTCALLVGTAEF